MSGIMLNIAGGSFGEPFPTIIGQAYGGGYYAGQIGVSSVATHYLVVGPLSTANASKKWKDVNTATPGADSVIDGPQNTADMVADGNATVYPAAHFCNDLVIGGFSDWYMPAINELDVCYVNLKPNTTSNDTSSGGNANAVPARAGNYTAGNPARTSASEFQTGNAEAYTAGNYWSSTEYDATNGRRIRFSDGSRGYGSAKYVGYSVRAVRRVAA